MMVEIVPALIFIAAALTGVAQKRRATEETRTAILLDHIEAQERLEVAAAPGKRVVSLEVICMVCTGAAGLVAGSMFNAVIPCSIAGLACGYLGAKRYIDRSRRAQSDRLDFYLPIVMERLVMAVQSGYDVLAAVAVIGDEGEESLDPVAPLLYEARRLSERGISFDAALRRVAATVSNNAVRHAFIHLAIAHTHGGELVVPLKELSDATQLRYQEIVEERIAKLPVQATLPLLCTFTGLILAFLSSPLIQLLRLTGDTMRRLQ